MILALPDKRQRFLTIIAKLAPRITTEKNENMLEVNHLAHMMYLLEEAMCTMECLSEAMGLDRYVYDGDSCNFEKPNEASAEAGLA